ncbi:hypothetical protein TNCV_1013261 [Trichonephila clavipes]|uniref:Uncharacterized protein n=1 Tax=Trichonephila clavipes TaxID=2585209 RepID=A0A8X6VXA2_TRICX|nr:hypothetical protein TNCV_1013261 [Trichonephila clavipes]
MNIPQEKGKDVLLASKQKKCVVPDDGPLASGKLYAKDDFRLEKMTATAGSDGVQSGRPIFDDFFPTFVPHIGNNTANVVFQMVKRLWLIRIDQ